MLHKTQHATNVAKGAKYDRDERRTHEQQLDFEDKKHKFKLKCDGKEEEEGCVSVVGKRG